MASSSHNPSDWQLQLKEFVIKCIRHDDPPAGEGIPSRTLVQMCVDHFCDEDTIDMRGEKVAIKNGIERMEDRGLLRGIERGGLVMYRLGEREKGKGRERDSGIGMGRLEDDNGEDKENDPNGGYEEEEGSTIEVQPLSAGAEEARKFPLHHPRFFPPPNIRAIERNADAYAEMTRGAAPIPNCRSREPTEPVLETPSRKRRRIGEIAPSDSSSMLSLSPRRCPNSTPRRRPMARMYSENEGEERRRSAPGQIEGSTSREQNMNDNRRHTVNFKAEKTDNSPDWLVTELAALRVNFPQDKFEARNGSIWCFDCVKPIKPGPRNVNYFAEHLGRPTHMGLRNKRIENEREKEAFFKSSQEVASTKGFDSTMFQDQNYTLAMAGCGGTTMDYNIPQQQDLLAFALKPGPSLEELGQQFIQGLSGNNLDLRAKINAAENRISKHDEVLQKGFGQIQGTLEFLEKRTDAKFDEISDAVSTSKTETTKELEELTNRIASKEVKDEEFEMSIKEVKSTTDSLSSSFLRNDAELVKLKDQIDGFVSAQTLDQKLDTKIEEKTKEATRRVRGLIDRTRELEKTTGEQTTHMSGLETLIRELEIKYGDVSGLKKQIEFWTGSHARQIEGLESEIKELKSREDDTSAVETHIAALEKKQARQIHDLEKRHTEQVKGLENQINELESQAQLHSDQFQLLETREEELKKTFRDQMDAHVAATAAQFAAFQKASKQKFESLEMAMERKFEERMKVFDWERREEGKVRAELNKESEKQDKEKAKKVKKLEKQVENLKEDVENLRKTIPLIFEDSGELRGFIEEVEGKVVDVMNSFSEASFGKGAEVKKEKQHSVQRAGSA